MSNQDTSKSNDPAAMTPIERRASVSLASIYGLRMLGMFIILPIFAIYAQTLPGGDDPRLVGMAMGVYGLAQAILQIPAGWMADHYGRKPVIYAGLLVFAIGSFVAASADNIYWIIAGRAIQGAGALNAAVMALTADLTREEHRTKAMAMIGMTIGVTFSISLVLSPLLYKLIGVSGIFIMTGGLALVALAVAAFVVPNPKITRFRSDTEANMKKIGEVLRNRDLLRLDFGIFALHAILMSVFMQVPFVLRQNGLDVEHHWQVYLPVMLVAFVLMVPPIIVAEKKAKMKPVFLGAVALAALAQVSLLLFQHSLWGIAFALLIFFSAFNVLEATLPSLVSKIAPLSAKGTAMGIYSSVQFFGAFFGATVAGIILHKGRDGSVTPDCLPHCADAVTLSGWGGNAVFIFALVLLLLWLVVAAGMKPPAAVRTKLYHLPELDAAQAAVLQQKLAQARGVREVMVVAAENMACIKADMQGFDEQLVEQLVKGE
ncbi:MAG: MFS transporter [Gallionellaceae bacterium]|jgi:MFS family permease|nr:MFS transporter [Gallionellaceae bacterium]